MADEAESDMEIHLERVGWTGEVTMDGDDITVEAPGTPSLRDVYFAIGLDEDRSGTVTVESQEQTLAIEYADGEVLDIEQREGSYTVNRMSRLEGIFQTGASLSVYLAIAGVLTAVLSVFFETPFSLVESTLAIGTGIIGFIVCIFLVTATPGITKGTNRGTPGGAIPGFDRLDEHIQVAMIAIDDAKSIRNESHYLAQTSIGVSMGLMALVAYLFVLAYINFGAWGVLGVALLAFARTLFGVVVSNGLGKVLDEYEDVRVDSIIDELDREVEESIDPVVYSYGEHGNPVHENIAMALPEQNTLIIPEGDVSNLRRDELKAVIAHEAKHITSHYPAVLSLIEVALYLVPAVVLFATDLSPTPLELGVGLFVYFLAFQAATGWIVRRWERQADAFAAEHSSPLSLAFALNRLVDEHVLDGTDKSLLADSAANTYSSHPIPHDRVARLVEEETD